MRSMLTFEHWGLEPQKDKRLQKGVKSFVDNSTGVLLRI